MDPLSCDDSAQMQDTSHSKVISFLKKPKKKNHSLFHSHPERPIRIIDKGRTNALNSSSPAVSCFIKKQTHPLHWTNRKQPTQSPGIASFQTSFFQAYMSSRQRRSRSFRTNERNRAKRRLIRAAQAGSSPLSLLFRVQPVCTGTRILEDSCQPSSGQDASLNTSHSEFKGILAATHIICND